MGVDYLKELRQPIFGIFGGRATPRTRVTSQGEYAIRTALGVSRTALFRQASVESLVLEAFDRVVLLLDGNAAGPRHRNPGAEFSGADHRQCASFRPETNRCDPCRPCCDCALKHDCQDQRRSSWNGKSPFICYLRFCRFCRFSLSVQLFGSFVVSSNNIRRM
jgi:hypothetical protein